MPQDSPAYPQHILPGAPVTQKGVTLRSPAFERPDLLGSLLLPAQRTGGGSVLVYEGTIAGRAGGSGGVPLLAHLLFSFVPAVVGALDDILGHVARAPAERYRRRQGHGSEHDQERWRSEFDRDLKLRQRGEDCVHHDGSLGDGAEDVDACSASDQTSHELGKESCQYQDQYRSYDVRDVGYELGKDGG